MERIQVKVKARAPRSEVLKEENNVFFVAVAAPPEGGKANRELVRFFSKKFGKKYRIVSGLKSKNKILESV